MEILEKEYAILQSLIDDQFSISSCAEQVQLIFDLGGFSEMYVEYEYETISKLLKNENKSLIKLIIECRGGYYRYLSSLEFDGFYTDIGFRNDWLILSKDSFYDLKVKLHNWKEYFQENNFVRSSSLRFWLIKYFLSEIFHRELDHVEISMIEERGSLNSLLFEKDNIEAIKYSLAFFYEEDVINSIVLDPDMSLNNLLPFTDIGKKLKLKEKALPNSIAKINFQKQYIFKGYRDYPVCKIYNYLLGVLND
ncbi:MAG: hypothetical protein CME63_16455 [Halobacteriovoraceae bacterium]|nr:hypothetical protein [Halobacteriovoraceae bacterium]|tara:strand:+ start:20648 stop:21400 length:753 start_codon:yes stop_codon:yes gene_type:complete